MWAVEPEKRQEGCCNWGTPRSVAKDSSAQPHKKPTAYYALDVCVLRARANDAKNRAQ